MNYTEEEQILFYIGLFKEYEKDDVLTKTFTNGFCHEFATLLKLKFGGDVVKLEDRQHYVLKKDKVYYDITGVVKRDC